MKIEEKWKKFVEEMNSRGIPIPTARDPKTKQGSVSLSMICVSFGLMAVCTIMAILLAVSKLSGFFTASDASLNSLKEAFSMGFQMSTLSAGLYWGRRFGKDDKGSVTLDSSPKNETN